MAAERLLHDSESANARAHTAAAVQLVALYKALGGGWEAPAAISTSPARPSLQQVSTSDR